MIIWPLKAVHGETGSLLNVNEASEAFRSEPRAAIKSASKFTLPRQPARKSCKTISEARLKFVR